MRFFRELKRRKVFRVAVVYAATVFAVLQGADILLPNLGVPDWAYRWAIEQGVFFPDMDPHAGPHRAISRSGLN